MRNTIRKTYRLRLSALMAEKQTSCETVACALNIPPTTFQNYYYGVSMPGIERAAEIATYFDTSIDYMIGRTEIKRK